jgi:hypothetical protein
MEHLALVIIAMFLARGNVVRARAKEEGVQGIWLGQMRCHARVLNSIASIGTWMGTECSDVCTLDDVRHDPWHLGAQPHKLLTRDLGDCPGLLAATQAFRWAVVKVDRQMVQ